MLKPASFQSLLDSGKAQFKRQRGLEKEDYTKAYDYLTAAVKAQPGSPEAHYFLGYTIDRINANDRAGMNRITKAQTLLASEQFEEVTRLEKKYTGEMVALDPYSKIGAIRAAWRRHISPGSCPTPLHGPMRRGSNTVASWSHCYHTTGNY